VSPVLFDTSVYITALREGRDNVVALRQLESKAPVWLSSVVLEELYAGAGPKDHAAVERLEREFDKARRILVPNLGDWAQTGKVLARLAAKHGYEQIGRGRLSNDALIAMSASRVGVTVITTNARDFARLAEFSTFTWSVV
jgi:predicted nucleic acid-binding protein